MTRIVRQLCDALQEMRDGFLAGCAYGDEGCWRPRDPPDPWCEWCLATKALRDAGRRVTYKEAAPPSPEKQTPEV